MTKFIIIIILFFLMFLFSAASIFDSVEWEKIYEFKGVTVYTQKDKNKKLNYYKAEKTIPKKCSESLYKNIMDFDSYPRIFPRTTIFKKVKQVSDNRYIMYSMINFKPLKNRDYYINFEFADNGKDHTVQWCSASDEDIDDDDPVEGVLRAKNINGRWFITEQGNKTKISVELHNDFKFNMSAASLLPYEVTSAAEMIEDIVDYTLNNK